MRHRSRSRRVGAAKVDDVAPICNSTDRRTEATVDAVTSIPATKHIIHAVIGVWYNGSRTFYVKRSEQMRNYPGAWSLFSIQFEPSELRDSLDLKAVQRLMDRMSIQRLYGTPVRVQRFLTATTCTNNPIDKIVNLRLYRIEFDGEPQLNPEYYADSAWLTQAQYLERSRHTTCGSCIRMWTDYYRSRDRHPDGDSRESEGG